MVSKAAAKRMAGVVNARMEQFAFSQGELARNAKVSRPTIKTLQDAEVHDFQDATLRKVARALELPANYLVDLRDGKEPREVASIVDDAGLTRVRELLKVAERAAADLRALLDPE